MAKETKFSQGDAAPISNQELRSFLESNQALLRENNELLHKIKSYITFQRVMSFIYIFLILAPIILSIIYLPPLLKNIISQYSSLLDTGSAETMLESVGSDILKK
jgi:hypothetical protein